MTPFVCVCACVCIYIYIYISVMFWCIHYGQSSITCKMVHFPKWLQPERDSFVLYRFVPTSSWNCIELVDTVGKNSLYQHSLNCTFHYWLCTWCVCVCVYRYICMYVSVYVCMYVFVCVCFCVCVCVCVCFCACVCVLISGTFLRRDVLCWLWESLLWAGLLTARRMDSPSHGSLT